MQDAKPALATDEHARIEQSVRTVLLLFAVFAAFYATNLVSFLPSIDDELAVFADAPKVWLAEGRFTMYLIDRFVMAKPLLPFLPLATFGLLSAVAYMVYLRTLGIRSHGLVHYLTFPLFVAFPTWIFLVEFAPNMLGVAPGMVMVSVAARGFAILFESASEGSLFTRANLRWIALSTILTATAAGIYQSFMTLQATLFLGVLLFSSCRRPLGSKRLAGGVALMLGLLAASTVVYLALAALFVAQAGSDARYVLGYFRPMDFVTNPFGVIHRSAVSAGLVYLGFRDVYGESSHWLALPLLFGVVGVWSVTKSVSWGRRLSIVLVAVAVLTSPFAMNLMVGGFLPIRALIGVPAAVWLFCMIGFTHASRSSSRIALLLVLPLVYFQMLQISDRFNANRFLARTHDQLLASAIYERITRVTPEFSAAKTYKIEFLGAKPFASPFARGLGSAGSASFFEWDGGNSRRIVPYMRLIGFNNLIEVTQEESADLRPAFRNMPVWPQDGSVRYENHVILVRLPAESPSMNQPPSDFEEDE